MLWELDTPPRDPKDRLGFETASSFYRRSIQGVQAIAALVSRFAIACDFVAREALMPAKAAEILRRLAARFRQFDRTDIAYAWSEFFGVTDDGLPLIGQVPGIVNCFAAFGYGGNASPSVPSPPK